jgi:hypothetical protein
MDETNFHIFISSCFEGLDTQVQRLVKNILESDIPSDFVHFIVGGCPSNEIYYNNGIEFVHVTYRCFEFTPFIYIANNPDKYDFMFAFFTHDTVKFGSNFYQTIKSDICFLKNNSFQTMKIENKPGYPSMNIGVYSKKIILDNKDKILSLKLDTNDPEELMKMKHKLLHYEDFILKQNSYNNGDESEIIPHEYIGLKGVKSRGLIRKFKRIDFIKYQSNAYTIQSIDICKIDDSI